MKMILKLIKAAWTEFKLCILLAFLLSCLSANAGNYVYLMNGFTSTNINAPLYGGTNGSGIYTNTFQVGQVPGASNIWFQLGGTSGLQPNHGTNGLLPSSCFVPQGNYPNTLYGPQNKITVIAYGSLMATNASSTAVLIKFATSIDGGTLVGNVNATGASLWVTNQTVLTMTIPVNSLGPTQPVTNNIDTYGWGYFNLQEIDNPGVSALTNIVIEVNGKPGL